MTGPRVVEDSVTSGAHASLGVTRGVTDEWAPPTPGRTA